MEQDITRVEIEEEFKICPACGYKDGFHTMLQRKKGVMKWLFICPACHQVFDAGMTVPVPE